MFRTITAQQIAEAHVPLDDIFALVLEGFDLHFRGQYEMPPKIGVHTRPESFMHAMPAYLPTKGLAGTKLVSVYPGNAARGLSTTTGLVALMAPDTGIITDVLDAAWITNMRTAMVSMADVRHLAVPDPVFGIVGAPGASGRAHLEAIAAIFPGSRVLLNSRSRDNCEELARTYDDFPLDLHIEMSHEALVRNSNVVAVVTSHLDEPIFRAEWLHPALNVLNVHSRGWSFDVLEHVDLVSCDDRRQLLGVTDGPRACLPDLDPDVELGAVIAGAQMGRSTHDQVIFSFNYGLGIFDLLVADYLRDHV